MIRIVLLWAWDPIGVRGIEEAVDEYDSYSQIVFQMLEAGVSDQRIADYLTSVVRDRIELPPNTTKDADVATMLRELYAIEA